MRYVWNWDRVDKLITPKPFQVWGYYDPDVDMFAMHQGCSTWREVDRAYSLDEVKEEFTFADKTRSGGEWLMHMTTSSDVTFLDSILTIAPECWLVPYYSRMNGFVHMHGVRLIEVATEG